MAIEVQLLAHLEVPVFALDRTERFFLRPQIEDDVERFVHHRHIVRGIVGAEHLEVGEDAARADAEHQPAFQHVIEEGDVRRHPGRMRLG